MSQGLASLEKGIAENTPPDVLWQSVESLAPEVGDDLGLRARYLLARAQVLNRLRNPSEALATLLEARNLAQQPGGEAYRSDISRVFAIIYAWQGRGYLAAMEVLRAHQEALATGQDRALACAVAEGGRVNKELGRYGVAAASFETALALPGLPENERARAQIGLLQALNDVGRHEACVRLVQDISAEADKFNDRLRWLLAIEHVRAQNALGQRDMAIALLSEARALLPEDRGAWEWTEYDLINLEVDAEGDEPGRHDRLRAVIDRCREDGLHLREAAARLALCDAVIEEGDHAVAMDEAGAALAIALREGNARIAERARSSILLCGQHVITGATETLLRERYVFCEVLGRGGNGTVRRAYDLETGAERAIKTVDFSAGLDGDSYKQLLRDAKSELEAARAVRYPGLVTIHDAFVEGSSIVVVQDFIRGVTLRRFSEGGQSRQVLLGILARIAEALNALHEAGVVHRDIKPENIMIDESRRPVIVDLGLSAYIGDNGDIVAPRGTPPYAAPELAGNPGLKAEASQDVFAFGTMLKELLPQEQGGLFRRLSAGARPNRLQRLVAELTSANPAKRPTSLRQAAATLELEHELAAL
ncbi:MAG: serine/threonine protein kinase [Rhizobiaceae bacterium]|nr:serine/threonine protein kinase [Rhizobiaceae bacterium]